MDEPQLIYEFGEFRLDVAEKRLLRKGGEVLNIPPKAFDLLRFLVENPGHLLEKNELLDKVWADSFVEEGNLKLHIHTLRKVLARDGEEFIETIPRRGYRFNADVALSNGELVVERFTRSKLTVAERSLPVKTQLGSGVKLAWIFALLVGGLTVAGFVYVGLIRPRTFPPVAAAPQTPISVAVLPLKNLTQDQRDDFLSVGLADALIERLTGIKALIVRPTSSILPFAASTEQPQTIGQTLRVESILGGTIQRVDDRIRVSMQLTATVDNRVLWADTFDAQESDLLKFQDAFSEDIAAALRLKISSNDLAELQHRETANPEAYRLYLTARYNFAQQRADTIVKAVELYKKAVELDPQFALAYAGIGESYMILGESGVGEMLPKQAYAHGVEAIQRALAIDPNLPEAYLVIGNIQAKSVWDNNASEAAYRRAIELNPNYARAYHLLGWTLIRESRFEEADTAFRKAAELNPTSLETASESGYPAFFAGDYERAILIFRESLDRDKTSLANHMHLWRAQLHAGRIAEAAGESTAIQKLVTGTVPVIEMVKARTLAAQGKTREAQQILEALITRKQKTDAYTGPLFIAILAADLDNPDLAFKYLDECVDERNDYMPYMRFAPEFTKYHNDPRFAALIQKIGV